jgi:predicted small integral membrane protein
MSNLNSFDENDFVYCNSCGNVLYGRTQPCYVCGKQMKTILTIARIKADRVYISLTILGFLTFTYLGLILPGIYPGIINAFAGILSIVLLYSLKEKIADMYAVRPLEKLNNNFKNISMEILAELKNKEKIETSENVSL